MRQRRLKAPASHPVAHHHCMSRVADQQGQGISRYGTRAYVDGVFEALRNRWGPSRSDGARAMQGLSANLCVLRDLRKQVFGWGVVWRWRNVAPV